jgi:hypothetical protein
MPSSFCKSRSNSYADARELVHRVIAAYVDVCSLPSLSTFLLRNDGFVTPQKILAPGSIASHFKCDVETITQRLLDGKPSLQETFWQIAQNIQPKGLAEVHLVQKLHRAYRTIDPWRYFRPTPRRGSVASQRRAA